jgi:hypothetical protein
MNTQSRSFEESDAVLQKSLPDVLPKETFQPELPYITCYVMLPKEHRFGTV